MKTAGVVGGTVGVLAAGAAVGLAVERYAIGRIRRGPDAGADEPYGRLPADRSRVVVAEDGVPLYVEEVGPADAPLTVVFVHGYGLAMGSFHFQRRELPGLLQVPVRMVFFDQRAHGRSGRGEAPASTVEQLGRDLAVILRDLGAERPVTLVGHSLGGMTIMALAEAEPEWFGERIRAVALLSTSAGMVSELKLSIPAALASLRRPLVPVVARGMTRSPALLERGRRAGAEIAWLLTRRYAFGRAEVSPALVGYVERMIAATPVDVLGEFLPVVMAHDKRGALPALARVPTLIMVGSRDALTSPEHSVAIAAAVPGARSVLLDGAGHLALMERPDETNEALREFLTEEAL